MDNLEKEFFIGIKKFRQHRFDALEAEYQKKNPGQNSDPEGERQLFKKISELLGPDKSLLVDYSDAVILNHYRDLHLFYNQGFEDCAALLSCCRKLCGSPERAGTEPGCQF